MATIAQVTPGYPQPFHSTNSSTIDAGLLEPLPLQALTQGDTDQARPGELLAQMREVAVEITEQTRLQQAAAAMAAEALAKSQLLFEEMKQRWAEQQETERENKEREERERVAREARVVNLAVENQMATESQLQFAQQTQHTHNPPPLICADAKGFARDAGKFAGRCSWQ